MRHKNAEMIIAATEDTELVVLIKVIDCESESGSYWAASSLSTLITACNEFFLCLPQHKDACLHWLGGGKSQSLSRGRWFDINEWEHQWSETSGFMREDFTTRIKPKKEKRWIVYRNGTVYGEFLSKGDINDDFIRTGQVIEIEVEV